MAEFVEWFRALLSNGWVWWLFAFSAVMFVAGLVLLPIIVIRIPEDYFLERVPPLPELRQHPVLAALFFIGRNLLGVVLIVLGVLLSLPGVPGQGILTIVVGLMLVTIPGKKRLILKIVRIPVVLNAINGLRARYGHPPLLLPDADPGDCEPRSDDRGE